MEANFLFYDDIGDAALSCQGRFLDFFQIQRQRIFNKKRLMIFGDIRRPIPAEMEFRSKSYQK